METSYLKTHLFGNRHPEWMPNLHSDCGQDSNPCAWGSKTPKAQAFINFIPSFRSLFPSSSSAVVNRGVLVGHKRVFCLLVAFLVLGQKLQIVTFILTTDTDFFIPH